MRKIFAHDAAHGTNSQVELLLSSAQEIAKKYSMRFQDITSTATRKVGAQSIGAALGGFGAAGQVGASLLTSVTEASLALIKVTQSAKEFKAKMREKIIAQANELPGTRSLMASYLEQDSSTNINSRASLIMQALETQGFMLNAQDIDYANCNKLESQALKPLDMGEFEYARSVILNNCLRIASYMGIESKTSLATTDANHKTSRSKLQGSLFGVFYNSVKGIFASELVAPVLNLPAGFVVGVASESLAKRLTSFASIAEAKQTIDQENSQQDLVYEESTNELSKQMDEELAEEVPIHKKGRKGTIDKSPSAPSITKVKAEAASKDKKQAEASADKQSSKTKVGKADKNSKSGKQPSSPKAGYGLRKFKPVSLEALEHDEDTDLHTVKSGDTVYEIAQEAKCEAQDIIDANPWLKTQGRINGNHILIYPGETLAVPSNNPMPYGTCAGDSSSCQNSYAIEEGRIVNTGQAHEGLRTQTVSHTHGQDYVEANREEGPLSEANTKIASLRKSHAKYLAVHSRTTEMAYKNDSNKIGELSTKYELTESVRIIETFDNPTTGARAHLFEITWPSGRKELGYAIAGTHDKFREVIELGKDIRNDLNLLSCSIKGAKDCATVVEERINWHVKNVKDYYAKTGEQRKVVINGHSAGGAEAIAAAAKMLDLVDKVHAFETLGSNSIAKYILKNNPEGFKELVSKTTIINAGATYIGVLKNHLEGATALYAPLSKGHSIEKLGDSIAKADYMLRVPPSFFKHGGIIKKLPNGEYSLQTRPAEAAQLAQIYGIDVSKLSARAFIHLQRLIQNQRCLT